MTNRRTRDRDDKEEEPEEKPAEREAREGEAETPPPEAGGWVVEDPDKGWVPQEPAIPPEGSTDPQVAPPALAVDPEPDPSDPPAP